MASSGMDFSGLDSYDTFDTGSIDMSTVEPNLEVDQTVGGTDGGASDVLDIANAVGQWGATIGSIVTGKPIATAQTRSGRIVPIGAPGSTVQTTRSGNQSIFVIGLVIVGVIVIVSMMQKKGAA